MIKSFRKIRPTCIVQLLLEKSSLLRETLYGIRYISTGCKTGFLEKHVTLGKQQKKVLLLMTGPLGQNGHRNFFFFLVFK